MPELPTLPTTTNQDQSTQEENFTNILTQHTLLVMTASRKVALLLKMRAKFDLLMVDVTRFRKRGKYLSGFLLFQSVEAQE